ncbi:MAG: uroporphyrinogen decarboxylase family protein [Anaerolineae bacterium]|jgi:hypothetical protein
MTPRERMLCAMRREPVDRPPLTPDFYLMFPTRFCGLSIWDVWGPRASVPLWVVRLATFRHFGFDAWLDAGIGLPVNAEYHRREIWADDESYEVETTIETPKGCLTERVVYPKHEGSWVTKYMVDDPIADSDKLIAMYEVDNGSHADDRHFQEVRRGVGDHGVVFCDGGQPPINAWCHLRGSQNGLADVALLGDFLRPIFETLERRTLATTEAACRAGAEVVSGGGSYITSSLISPEWYARYVVPTLRKQAEICHQYGVLFAVQTNGRSRAILPLIRDAGVDVLYPLERPPLGDVCIAEAKRVIGNHVCLMGNVDPVHTLLRGTPEAVRREVREIAAAAGAGPGGLVISTSDQTCRDTPEINLWAYREALEP